VLTTEELPPATVEPVSPGQAVLLDPGAHCVHIAAPGVEYVPAAHTAHVGHPSYGLKVPAGHVWHGAIPVLGEKVPGAQSGAVVGVPKSCHSPSPVASACAPVPAIRVTTNT